MSPRILADIVVFKKCCTAVSLGHMEYSVAHYLKGCQLPGALEKGMGLDMMLGYSPVNTPVQHSQQWEVSESVNRKSTAMGNKERITTTHPQGEMSLAERRKPSLQ